MNRWETSIDGFQLYFFHIGNGSSCLIKCPDDTAVVVDFGSNDEVTGDQIEKIRQNISTYVKGNRIKAVVLSCPVKSRYNQIAAVFKDYTIENVYYSSKADGLSYESPMDNYLDQGTGKSILHKNVGSPQLNEVTINQQNQTRFVCPFDFQYGSDLLPEENIENSKLVISEDKGDNKWEISIVSGNVKSRYSHKKRQRETASLVTYIRINQCKVLMLSDASQETMEFLRVRHPQIMENMISCPISSNHVLFYPAKIFGDAKIMQDGDMKIIIGSKDMENSNGEGGKE